MPTKGIVASRSSQDSENDRALACGLPTFLARYTKKCPADAAMRRKCP